MAKLHSQLTGTDLHAPKGFEVENGDVKLYLSQSTNILSSSVSIIPNDSSVSLGDSTNRWSEVIATSITASSIVDFNGDPLVPEGSVSSSSQIIYNDITNNPFNNSNGVVTASLSIIPENENIDLGSVEKPFKDVYISSASLYVDGVQVLSSDADEITISSDANQSIKLVEQGDDTITFESENGNIVFASTGTGVIQTTTDLQIDSGNKIISNNGLVNFGVGLGITGSIDLTGNVDGVDIAGFKSSFDTLEGKTLVSSSTQVDITSTTNYDQVVQTTGNQSIGGIKTFTDDNIFNGTQTFNDLVINGTGSFAYLQQVTGSVKLIGDAFIALNNDTPAERYAGIKVFDSGSLSATSSLQFDGQSNDWFYEYEDDNDETDYGVILFGPEYGTKGSPSYLTNNTIPKGDGGHHLNDSNITDDGSTITLGSNTSITGTLVSTATTLVSSSAQINADTITNFDSNVKAKMDADNVVSGSVDSFAVSNSADNRVITSVDSSNGNAEANLTFDGSTLTVNGTIVETSAREYKDNIVSLETELPSVMKLNPVTYSWKGKEDINYGFIADEVGEIYPDLLNETQSGIQYSKMVSVLTKAIQELNELVEKQDKRIQELENK